MGVSPISRTTRVFLASFRHVWSWLPRAMIGVNRSIGVCMTLCSALPGSFTTASRALYQREYVKHIV